MSHLDRHHNESNLDVSLRFQQHLADRAYARSRFEPPTDEEVAAELERRKQNTKRCDGDTRVSSGDAQAGLE